MSKEIREKSQELLRKEFGISKEEWVVFYQTGSLEKARFSMPDCWQLLHNL